MDTLRPDPETRFSCSQCARCCTGRWEILMRAEDAEAIRALPLGEIGREASAIKPAGAGLFKLAKAGDGRRCVMLDDDDLCALHKRFGEASKPTACRRFPYLTVASDEHVWATANYGCKAVQEHRGAPLSEQSEALSALYAKDLSEADPGADTLYPMGPGKDLSTPQVDAAFEALIEAMGDAFFPALRQLAAFVSVCHDPDADGVGEAEDARREPPTQAAPEVRHAFALTIYQDLLDPFSVVDRVRGVWALPKLLGFEHRYHSRLLDRDVGMRQIAHHPGALPLKAERMMLRWLRSRLRARLVFKDVPHAAAGITRLILQADAVLYLARARAGETSITNEDALVALELVELYVAHQRVLTDLARLDPRLRAAWEDPAVARGAAQLFTPAGVWSAHSVSIRL
ncbi:MAG: YkgJ family cysteine cluster protein [Alphaproteobacteria bacterium]|nr:YkgJ family cysteine cluster protein [Alphaproteobacteria bacterium]MCB9793892.1 YkgJ family cysteine cluster protein [Alphaproteobacteria bacterium]